MTRARGLGVILLFLGILFVAVDDRRACGGPILASAKDWVEVNRLLDLLDSGDRQSRLRAIDGQWWPFIAQNTPLEAGHAADRLLAYIARETDPWLIHRLACQFAHLRSPALEVVSAALIDHYAPSVRAAAVSIGDLCSEEHVQRLLARAEHEPAPWVLLEVLGALNACDRREHLDACFAGLFSSDEGIAAVAVACARRRSDPADTELLLRRADEGPPHLRALALAAVARRADQIDDEEQRRQLRRRVEAIGGSAMPWLVEQEWLKLAAALESERAGKLLLRIVRSGDDGAARWAAQVAAHNRIPGAAETIMRRSKGQGARTTQAFLHALVDLQLSADVEEFLLERAAHDEPEWSRWAVVLALAGPGGGRDDEAAVRILEWIAAADPHHGIAERARIHAGRRRLVAASLLAVRTSRIVSFIPPPNDPTRHAVNPGRRLDSFRCHAEPGVEHPPEQSLRLAVDAPVSWFERYDDGVERWVNLVLQDRHEISCWIPEAWVYRYEGRSVGDRLFEVGDFDLAIDLVTADEILELERRRILETFDTGTEVVGARLSTGLDEAILASLPDALVRSISQKTR